MGDCGGDDLYRDTKHLIRNRGRGVAACAGYYYAGGSDHIRTPAYQGKVRPVKKEGERHKAYAYCFPGSGCSILR